MYFYDTKCATTQYQHRNLIELKYKKCKPLSVCIFFVYGRRITLAMLLRSILFNSHIINPKIVYEEIFILRMTAL